MMVRFYLEYFLEAVSPPPFDIWQLPDFGVNINTMNVLVKSFNFSLIAFANDNFFIKIY